MNSGVMQKEGNFATNSISKGIIFNLESDARQVARPQ